MKKRLQFRKNKIPEISCRISIAMPLHDETHEKIPLELKKMKITDVTKIYPKIGNEVVYNFASIKYSNYWYLNDSINDMFSKIEDSFENLCDFLKSLNCSVVIDIAFIHYSTFPALIISSENICKINKLNAELSIDPY